MQNSQNSFNFDWAHKHQETIYNDRGAGQSKLHRDWTLVPWNAMAAIVKVLETGAAKYGRDSWRNIPVHQQLQHMMEHAIAQHMCDDDPLTQIEHLTRVVCRALFALDLLIEEFQEDEQDELRRRIASQVGQLDNANRVRFSSGSYTVPPTHYGNGGDKPEGNNEASRGISEFETF